MIELIWLMRYGILKIISFVEPFCRTSPSTCHLIVPLNFFRWNDEFMETNESTEEMAIEPLARVQGYQGQAPSISGAAYTSNVRFCIID